MRRVAFLPMLAPILLITGAVMVVLAFLTPQYTDPLSYATGFDALQAELYGSTDPDFGAASEAFHQLQDRHHTAKWFYADMGYAALAWAALVLMAASARKHGWISVRWTTRSAGVLIVTCLLAVMLTTVGVIASAFQAYTRAELPPWADSLAIPLMGALGFSPILLGVLGLLSLAPLALRQRPASLFALRGRGHGSSVLVTLVYLPPLLLAGSGLLSVADSGGWALSTGSALMCWLILNGRAIWLGEND